MLAPSSPATLRLFNLARSEANALGHNWVGCEHLLLGLLHEDGGDAARCLAEEGISLGDARAEVVRQIGRREQAVTTISPLSPGAERVLEASEKEAALGGDPHVEPMHLLYALLGEFEGVHISVLRKLHRGSE